MRWNVYFKRYGIESCFLKKTRSAREIVPRILTYLSSVVAVPTHQHESCSRLELYTAHTALCCASKHTNTKLYKKATLKRGNIPFLAPMAKATQSNTKKGKNCFHEHLESSVTIMAVCLSLNISHFYNTERGNIDEMDYSPLNPPGE